MKTIYIPLVIIFLLTGCATTPVAINEAKPAPAERALAFQAEGNNKTATLTVVRDQGFMGSGCYYSLYINRTLAARLDVAEIAKFILDPGEILLKIGRDPLGNGLCSLGQEHWTQRETILKPGEQKIFRMTIGVNGEMDIIRSDL